MLRAWFGLGRAKMPLFIIALCLLTLTWVMGWNCYYWHLEKYGGTYCHLEDKWVYIEREDMLDALAAASSVLRSHAKYGAHGQLLYDDDHQVIFEPPGRPKGALAVAHRLRLQFSNKFELRRYLSLRDPTYLILPTISSPYLRANGEMAVDRPIDGCHLYKIIQDSRS